jgi:hypothetical protein
MVGGCLSGCSRGHCCRRAMSRAFHLWFGSGKKLHRVESVRQQGRAEYGRSVEGDHSSTVVCRKPRLVVNVGGVACV